MHLEIQHLWELHDSMSIGKDLSLCLLLEKSEKIRHCNISILTKGGLLPPKYESDGTVHDLRDGLRWGKEKNALNCLFPWMKHIEKAYFYLTLQYR